MPFDLGRYANPYAEGSGTPSSLVLGGYDKKRFESHDVEFTLTRDTALPQAKVRGIEISAPKGNRPDSWDSDTRVLSRMNESFEAIIDSSTPYLWLPQSVCDNFVSALRLTWNKTLDAYEINDDQFKALKSDDSYSFTFSLSSYDNNDDFGRPLDAPGVVNITVSARAFAQTLEYPYNDMAIQYKEGAQPYFPIKPASDDTFILGRTFLQEAYLLTKYDSTVFSVYQALFPEDRLDTDIVAVEQPSNSAYPPPGDSGGGGLPKGKIIGIVVGAVLGSAIALSAALFVYCRRRRKARMAKMFPDENAKETASSIIPETPRTPVARIFSMITRRKRPRKIESPETSGTDGAPAEVGADATHAVYEMPVPPSPVELDADTYSISSETEMGTGGEDLSAYEAARRKMERRLQGPVPAYSPPTDVVPGTDGEGDKFARDVSPMETYRPSDRVSPTSSPTEGNTDSMPLPSPMTPITREWNRSGDLPSPTAAHLPVPSPTTPGGPGLPGSVSPRSQTYASSLSRTDSSTAPSPTSATSTTPGPFQRTPIDPSRIVCLGPLPENVQLPIPSPTRSTLPRSEPPESPGVMGDSGGRVSTDTLGSNFTDMEEQLARKESESGGEGTRGGAMLASPHSRERIDGGTELVHVPQLADKRYSWEEER